MAWSMSTRWIDTNNNNLDNVIANIMEDNEVLNPVGASITYTNLVKHKRLNQNSRVSFDNRIVEYNVIEFSLDQIQPGQELLETRTTVINGEIIVYFDGTNINYLINRNSDALKLLRKILNYDNRGEIVMNAIDFDNDIFMWLIKKVFEEDNYFSYIDTRMEEKEIVVNSIIGVRGELAGENKLSAQGNTVLNLISTLSFVLESEKLRQLILRTESNDHENIEMKLNDKGVVSVDVNKYSGAYEDDGLNNYELKAQVLLFVYLVFLPKLKFFYHEECEDNLWSVEVKAKFLELIQERLVERLEERQNQILNEQ